MTAIETRFVVTRPAPDHRQLLAAFAARGLKTIHCPAFQLERHSEPLLQKRLHKLDHHHLVIVVSPFAARILAERLAADEVSRTEFIVPGRGTASELASAGISARFPASGGTSEDILDVPALKEVDGKRVAIVGAPGGRGLLARALADRGAVVERIHVYRRNLLPPDSELLDALRRQQDLVVLISSPQTFGMLLDAIPETLRPAWLASRFVVSSSRLERICRRGGVCRVDAAGSASDDQMLAAALMQGRSAGVPG